MTGKGESTPVTSDQFVWGLITWIISRYGGAVDSSSSEPAPTLAGKLVAYSVQIRPEHVSALRSAAAKRGTTITRVLNDALDEWLSVEYARSQS